MDYDAFSAGVEPGGLRTKNEIRILICYLLTSIHVPLSKEDIIRIMQENGLANYFEITNALAELIDNGNLLPSKEDPALFTVTKQARMIAQRLDNAVPVSVKERAMAAAMHLLAEAKLERENRVEITPMERGYNVTCHISGGDMELMHVSLYVPDLIQANSVKEKFYQSPQRVYQMLLALMTNDKTMANDVLTHWNPKQEDSSL